MFPLFLSPLLPKVLTAKPKTTLKMQEALVHMFTPSSFSANEYVVLYTRHCNLLLRVYSCMCVRILYQEIFDSRV